MNKLLIIMIVYTCSIFAACERLESKSKGFTIPDLVVDANSNKLNVDDSGVMSYLGKPFSGHLVSHYPNGVLKLKEPYLDGLKEGMALSFYVTGDSLFKRTYHLGKKHGVHIGWHKNGNLKYEYIFQNGLNIGEHKEWYEDGKIYSVSHYKDGREFGSQKVWRPDGKIRANYVIRENGKKYGLMGLKRCKTININDERFKE